MQSIARTRTRVKALYLCRDNSARFLEDHAETEGNLFIDQVRRSFRGELGQQQLKVIKLMVPADSSQFDPVGIRHPNTFLHAGFRFLQGWFSEWVLCSSAGTVPLRPHVFAWERFCTERSATSTRRLPFVVLTLTLPPNAPADLLFFAFLLPLLPHTPTNPPLSGSMRWRHHPRRTNPRTKTSKGTKARAAPAGIISSEEINVSRRGLVVVVVVVVALCQTTPARPWTSSTPSPGRDAIVCRWAPPFLRPALTPCNPAASPLPPQPHPEEEQEEGSERRAGGGARERRGGSRVQRSA
jgi:hypothetical protein